ncbi:hypothetical protein B932_1768 [Gluconobacter oxydans H24]|nr:hypothetical protein B932_1768 [Gluconobacter oxydans H24]
MVSTLARIMFMVGICGGHITFSSFSRQTVDLPRTDMPTGPA